MKPWFFLEILQSNFLLAFWKEILHFPTPSQVELISSLHYDVHYNIYISSLMEL